MKSSAGVAVSLLIASLVLAGSACRAAESPVSGQAIDQRIQQYRTAEVTLRVTDAAGKPVAGTDVAIEMVRHKFLFGCNAFMLERCGTNSLDQRYAQRFSALFNYATLPFYWNAYEPRPGRTEQARLTKMAGWCRAGGIRPKGHPLCWHESAPRWLEGKPTDEIRRLQVARVEREVQAFKGLIDTWDVVNEVMSTPRVDKNNPVTRLCNERGPLDLIRTMFTASRGANPKAMLILNDYDTSPACSAQTGKFLEAGIPIDVIGIQSHFHTGCARSEETWAACQRFAKLGRPLHFTETTILSGRLKTDNDWNRTQSGWNTTAEGEQLQARQAVEFYRLLFSHPAVEALTWWDFSDLGAWMGAPSGLVRKDMSPKPAYDALVKLVKGQWWTGPLKLTTDAAGEVSFHGYLGQYAIQSGGGRAEFGVARCGKELLTVSIPAAR